MGGSMVTLAEVVDFQAWLDQCVPEELSYSGCTYTWNDKSEVNRIFSKIDWCFMNGDG